MTALGQQDGLGKLMVKVHREGNAMAAETS